MRDESATQSHPELNEFQKQVNFGSMLGDLSAEKVNLTGNTRLRFYMSSINKDLINHLYSIFKDYVKTEPKLINRKINKRTGGLHTDIYFTTLKYPLFNWRGGAGVPSQPEKNFISRF